MPKQNASLMQSEEILLEYGEQIEVGLEIGKGVSESPVHVDDQQEEIRIKPQFVFLEIHNNFCNRV